MWILLCSLTWFVSRLLSPSLSQWCWCLCLPLSVNQLAIQSVSQSVRCHSASPVMAVPINVFLCHSAHYRHRYYTALLMALSDGLFTEPVTKTDSGLLSVWVCVWVCVFEHVYVSVTGIKKSVQEINGHPSTRHSDVSAKFLWATFQSGSSLSYSLPSCSIIWLICHFIER